jgi:type IV secretion system protein TrbB
MLEPTDFEVRQFESLKGHAHILLPYLKQADVNDVVVNEDGRVWVNRARAGWKHVDQVPSKITTLILRSVATIRKIPFDHGNPILETIFPLDGSRIEGVIPPVTPNAILAIRLRPRVMYTFADYEASGALTNQNDELNRKRFHDDFLEQLGGKSHREILELAVQYRRNILCVGGTGTGKTTFLNAILHDIQERTPDDRVVIIEDTPELQCSVPNAVTLLATSQVSQADCLVASLRLKPDRILLGEVRRRRPAQVLLEAWNTGHAGGLATVHADDSRKGLLRLERMVATRTARAEVSESVNVVVFIDKEVGTDAGRKIREILIVQGLTNKGEYNCLPV